MLAGAVPVAPVGSPTGRLAWRVFFADHEALPIGVPEPADCLGPIIRSVSCVHLDYICLFVVEVLKLAHPDAVYNVNLEPLYFSFNIKQPVYGATGVNAPT